MSRPNRKGGFTLIEVLIVSVIVGILAGITTPSLSRVLDRAGATKVQADVHTLSVATRSFLEAGGTLPPTADPGVPPIELNAYIEEHMTFTFRDATYRFVTQPAMGAAQLWVDYPATSGLGVALRRLRRTGMVTWTPTRTTFVLVN